MKWSWGKLCAAATFIVMMAFAASGVAGAASVPVVPGTATLEAFPPAEECGCHAQRVSEWSASMHVRALADPAFVYKTAQADKATGGKLGPFCKTCHAPAAAMVGAFSANTTPTGGAGQGIGCVFCHQVTGTSQPVANVSHLVEASGVYRAQIADAKAPHPARFSSFHRDSALCGGCHNVNHPINGMHLEATYAEWLASPYAKEGVACQSCHMGDQPGNAAPVRGQAAAGAHPRDDIFYMTFAGANVAQGDPVLARKNLQAAAKVELDVASIIEPGTPALATVTITNVGAGHYLPTGLTEVREMWAEIVAIGEDGEEAVLGERRFGTILQDDAGKAPVELWEATRIKSDDRIPPRGSVTVSATVEMPAEDDAYMIEARLNYRSLPEEFAAEAKVENPTTLMASARQPVFGSESARDEGYADPTTEEAPGGTPWGAIVWVGSILAVIAVGGFALVRASRS